MEESDVILNAADGDEEKEPADKEEHGSAMLEEGASRSLPSASSSRGYFDESS